MEGVTNGRVVHYVISDSDAQEINARRYAADIPKDEKIEAIQYHVGSVVNAGDHCAMVITRVHNAEIGLINGKVLLDGIDDHWVTSRSYSDEKMPGSWHWIEKA